MLVKKINASLCAIKNNYRLIEKNLRAEPLNDWNFLTRNKFEQYSLKLNGNNNKNNERCVNKVLLTTLKSKKRKLDVKVANLINKFLSEIKPANKTSSSVIRRVRAPTDTSKSLSNRKYLVFTDLIKTYKSACRDVTTPTITNKKKLKAIYNSSEFKSIPQ